MDPVQTLGETPSLIIVNNLQSKYTHLYTTTSPLLVVLASVTTFHQSTLSYVYCCQQTFSWYVSQVFWDKKLVTGHPPSSITETELYHKTSSLWVNYLDTCTFLALSQVTFVTNKTIYLTTNQCPVVSSSVPLGLGLYTNNCCWKCCNCCHINSIKHLNIHRRITKVGIEKYVIIVSLLSDKTYFKSPQH